MVKNTKNKSSYGHNIRSKELSGLELDSIRLFKNLFDNKLFLYQVYHLSNMELEQIYGLGYSMLQNEQYIDAEEIFRSLCLLKHDEERFWLGLGICLQKQKKYQHANMMYGMSIICNPRNPLVYLLASQCSLAEHDASTAKFILENANKILGKDPKYKAINQIIKKEIKSITKS